MARREARLEPRTKSIASTFLLLFAMLVVAGYTIPWAWTGFRGNTLWDWLGPIVLPVTLLLMPRLAELRNDWRRHHTVVAGIALAVFAAVVLGGYLGGWTWTGFTGNTLWDWLHLLLLPLLLPTVILPAVKPLVMRRVPVVGEDQSRTTSAERKTTPIADERPPSRPATA
jgi:MFS family permease